MKDNVAQIIERYRSSIRRGTGEAVLLMQQNPEIDFSREIITGARKCVGYDPQCEGGRDKYFSLLIDLVPQKESIINKLLDILAKAKSNDWDWEMSQLNYLAARYARRGNERARRILYQLYRRNLGSEAALIGGDGINALKFIAEIKGKLLLRNSKQVQDDWTIEGDYLIQTTKEKAPESNPKKELVKESRTNPFIRRYLNEVTKNMLDRAKTRKENQRTRKIKPTYELMNKMIHNVETFRHYVGKDLSEKDATKLAEDFLRERDAERIYRYLRIFTIVLFPLGYEPLIKYAISKNRRLRWPAIQALGLYKNKAIRKLALESIRAGKHADEYLELLILNFKRTDNRLIADTLRQIKNADAFHFAIGRALHIYERNKTRGCMDAMLQIYDRGTCSICRNAALQVMIDNKVLPQRLKDEMKYDSYVDSDDPE